MNPFLTTLSQLKNDIHDVDHITVQHKLNDNARFSFSFLMLLIASTTICTMGLLSNSPSVVIGGMLISPLMWPLMKISLGISMGSKRSLSDALGILSIALFVSLLCSFLITYFSPLKVVNAEILARTQPTLLDLFIALAAGSIATLGLIQRRISDSLAGVAIAVSLLPPLCVGGIGLALWAPSVFSGGLLLFIANSISITFASLVIFILVGVTRKTNTPLKREGIALVAIALFITAIPLFILLKDYSFQASAYQKTHKVLSASLSLLSPESSIANITVNTSNQKTQGGILIEADILLPEGTFLTSQTQQALVDKLQQALNRPIDLRLRLQQTISLLSKEDEYQQSFEKTLRQTLEARLDENGSSLVIHSLQTKHRSDNTWQATVLLRGDPSDIPSEQERHTLETELTKKFSEHVTLTLEVIPGLAPLTESAVEDNIIKARLTSLLSKTFPQAEVIAVSLASTPVTENENGNTIRKTTATVDMRVPQTFRAPKPTLEILTAQLEEEYGREFLLILRTVEVKVFTN